MNRFLSAAIVVFMAICVFDPADHILGVKVPLFCLCLGLTFIFMMPLWRDNGIHMGLLFYILTMILIPLFSILNYQIRDGGMPYEGFPLLKGYLFILFAVVLYYSRLDYIKTISMILTVLSASVIVVYGVIVLEPTLFHPIHAFGVKSGLISLDKRAYSPDLKLLSVFFVTSPMLVIPISHYLQKAFTVANTKRWIYGGLALFNIAAMFMAGTRNNMATSICLPVSIYVLNSRKRWLTIGFCLAAMVGGIVLFGDAVIDMLSPTEFSNSLKLGLLSDYRKLFNDPYTLFFGQGLGAYSYWEVRGYEYFITELTYLEVIRNFGILMGAVIIFLLIYPMIYAFFLNRRIDIKHLVIGYAFYLGMAITNPLMFSSVGMLVLSVVLAQLFKYDATGQQHLGAIRPAGLTPEAA